MRAVIYARYSSDQQRSASIEDQLEVCRRLIEREGWQLVEVYEDRAVSGASRFRPGYQKLLADLEARRFDVVVVEGLDRLGRKLADIADLHDRLAFADVQLHAVSTGAITALHIGILGTMAQLYLADLRDKTWRGQLGRALQGRIPGGLAYGYTVVEPEGARAGRGERRINPAEAAVVRRIFTEFATGMSPRAIAKRLNGGGVPGPRGRPWRDTAIRGHPERGIGILNNMVYIGRLAWNRCSYRKDPRSGKRVARPNPAKRWEVVAVPELRIVDDPLWQAVKARQAEVGFTLARDAAGNALNQAHRHQYLLSGLLVCGGCGGGYTIIGKDRYGCAGRRAKGTCANTRTVRRLVIEARVLAGLKERLLAPELVQTFIAEFQAEVNRAAQETRSHQEVRRHELGSIERKIAALVRTIEDGGWSAAVAERLRALEGQKAELVAELERAAPAPVLRLHPGLPELYADTVARLEEALADDAIKAEAVATLRALIDKVVLTRDAAAPDGLRAELYGDLDGILAACEAAEPTRRRPGARGCQLSVVSGT